MIRPEFTLADLLHNAAERTPDAQAIIDREGTYTYGRLFREATALAESLRGAGLLRGARAGIFMEKRWEAVVGA
jgi:acyl-CoA synthetase (AMP-forming)/AMP-acid ligase II